MHVRMFTCLDRLNLAISYSPDKFQAEDVPCQYKAGRIQGQRHQHVFLLEKRTECPECKN